MALVGKQRFDSANIATPPGLRTLATSLQMDKGLLR